MKVFTKVNEKLAEYRVTEEEGRKTRSLNHQMRVEWFTLAAMAAGMIFGALLIWNNSNETFRTIGSFLISGPIGAFIQAHTSSSQRKANSN
jgi:hypothetical protein